MGNKHTFFINLTGSTIEPYMNRGLFAVQEENFDFIPLDSYSLSKWHNQCDACVREIEYYVNNYRLHGKYEQKNYNVIFYIDLSSNIELEEAWENSRSACNYDEYHSALGTVKEVIRGYLYKTFYMELEKKGLFTTQREKEEIRKMNNDYSIPKEKILKQNILVIFANDKVYDPNAKMTDAWKAEYFSKYLGLTESGIQKACQKISELKAEYNDSSASKQKRQQIEEEIIAELEYERVSFCPNLADSIVLERYNESDVFHEAIQSLYVNRAEAVSATDFRSNLYAFFNLFYAQFIKNSIQYVDFIISANKQPNSLDVKNNRLELMAYLSNCIANDIFVSERFEYDVMEDGVVREIRSLDKNKAKSILKQKRKRFSTLQKKLNSPNYAPLIRNGFNPPLYQLTERYITDNDVKRTANPQEALYPLTRPVLANRQSQDSSEVTEASQVLITAKQVEQGGDELKDRLREETLGYTEFSHDNQMPPNLRKPGSERMYEAVEVSHMNRETVLKKGKSNYDNCVRIYLETANDFQYQGPDVKKEKKEAHKLRNDSRILYGMGMPCLLLGIIVLLSICIPFFTLQSDSIFTLESFLPLLAACITVLLLLLLFFAVAYIKIQKKKKEYTSAVQKTNSQVQKKQYSNDEQVQKYQLLLNRDIPRVRASYWFYSDSLFYQHCANRNEAKKQHHFEKISAMVNSLNYMLGMQEDEDTEDAEVSDTQIEELINTISFAEPYSSGKNKEVYSLFTKEELNLIYDSKEDK